MSRPKPDPVSLIKSLSPDSQQDLANFILASCRYSQEATRKEAEYLGSVSRLHREKLNGLRKN